jgi:hypothetical protein
MRSRPNARRWAALAVALCLALLSVGPAAANPPSTTGGTTGGHPPREAGPHRAEQAPTGRAAVRQQRQASISALSAAPADDQLFAVQSVTNTVLSTTFTSRIIEPLGNGFDDLHISYNDQNYWNFCTAGAAAVAAYYWIPNAVSGRPGQNYTEPYGPHKSTTYWRSSDTGTSSDTSNGFATKGRGYLMYLAEYTKPPSYSRPGIVDFTYYSSRGGSIGDAALALNWEIFGDEHFFWSLKRVPGVSQTTFVNDVKADLFDYGTPVLVAVNTYVSSSVRLPNWTRSIGHAIAIVGYDDATSKFTYIDTCGRACNTSAGNTNGGTFTVSYTTMYKLIANFGYGYIS